MTETDDAQRTRLAKLATLPDDSIDTSDIPEVTDWSDAVRGGLYKPRKEAITIRVDADVLAWFRSLSSDGKGYQSEINSALRKHVQRTRTRRA